MSIFCLRVCGYMCVGWMDEWGWWIRMLLFLYIYIFFIVFISIILLFIYIFSSSFSSSSILLNKFQFTLLFLNAITKTIFFLPFFLFPIHILRNRNTNWTKKNRNYSINLVYIYIFGCWKRAFELQCRQFNSFRLFLLSFPYLF